MEYNLFSVLPTEINYEIVKEFHPYLTINNYCKVDKFNRQYCEKIKYELLQEWVHPEMTIKQLQSEYPNISLTDVANLSLVYNPIVEIFESDLKLVNDIPVSVELILTNAFYLGKGDVMRYIIDRIPIWDNNNRFSKVHIIDVLFNLCFADNNVEPLQYAYEAALTLNFDSELTKEIITYLHITNMKLGIDFEALDPDDYIITRWRSNETLLWDLELWCEYQVIYYYLSEVDSIYSRLTGELQPQPNDYLDYCYFIAYLVGKEMLETIISKYLDTPDIRIYTYIQNRYDGNIITSLYRDCMTFGQLLFEPTSAAEYFNKSELVGYYLLSGLYDYYISAKLIIGVDIEEKYYPSSGDIFGNNRNIKIHGVTVNSYNYDYTSCVYSSYDSADD